MFHAECMKLTSKGLEAIVKRRKLEVPTALISLQLKELVSGSVQRFGRIIVRIGKFLSCLVLGWLPYAQHLKGLDGLICRLYKRA